MEMFQNILSSLFRLFKKNKVKYRRDLQPLFSMRALRYVFMFNCYVNMSALFPLILLFKLIIFMFNISSLHFYRNSSENKNLTTCELFMRALPI